MVATKAELSVSIGKFKLRNPIMTASGTFGYADEYEEYLKLQDIGAVVTKGITLQPREGNTQLRIREVKNGLINSIGLENIGIYSFIEDKLPVLTSKSINFVLNIAGFSVKEYVELAKIADQNKVPALELNVSCPNVEHGCYEFGRDPDTLYELVSQVRDVYSGTLIIKLSANVSYPDKLALAVERAQADAISAINTVRAMNIKIGTDFKKSVIRGGLSGSVIKPIALNFIYEIKQVTDLPVIGIGGISSIDDVLEFFAVGATAVQVGTANFAYPYISEILVKELENFLEKNNFVGINDLINEVKNEDYRKN